MSSVEKGNQYYSGFSPTTIPGCTLWLDGADSASVTVSSSKVSQWSDKSGNGYNFTVHPSHTAPSYSLKAINGLNSLSFERNNTGSTYYNLLYNTTIPINGPAFSIFTVARRNASAPSQTGGNYILTDNTNSRLLFITYTSDFLLTSTANSTSGWNDITVNSPGQTLFTTTVSGMVVNGSVLTPYVNGTAQNTKGGTTTSFTGLSIGDVLNSGNSGQTWAGFICEIVIYNFAISTPQRQQIEGYLARKWGVLKSSLLTTGHPYFSSPFSITPTTIPGCVMWLDAADPNGTGTTPTSGSSISTWVDKSGLNNSMTSVGTVLYQDSPSRINVNSSYLTNATVSYSTNTLFIVAMKTSTTGPLYTTSGIDFGGLFPNEGGTMYWARSDTTWYTQTSTITSNVINLIGVQYDGSASGANMYLWLSGALNAQSTTDGTLTRDRLRLAHRAFNNQYMGGNYYEVLLYNTALTTAQRQQIEGYLAWKWGSKLAVLPSTHPYVSIPPFTRPFNPVDVSGCSLWLDAADSTTMTLSGSNVSQWNDKSGNGRNAVVSSTAFATLTGTPPGLLFNNSFYTTTLSGDPSVETGFVVYNVSSAGMLVGGYSSGRQIGFQTLTLVGPLKTLIAWGPLATSTANVRQMLTTFVSSSATSSAVNGGTAVTGGGLTFTSSNVTTLGREAGANFPYGGFVHEVILFNTTLTAPERQQIETYLANKWGLRGSTPSTHLARIAPALSVSLLPPQISPCSVWLDAADLTTLTLSGSNVTAWRDKSGIGANATFVGTNVYSSSARYVQTPGGTGYFSVPCDLRKTPTPQCSLFTVHKWITNTGDNQALWGTDDGGGWNRIQLLPFPGYTQIAFGLSLGNAAPNTYAVNGLNTMNTVMYSAIYDLNVTNGTTAHVNGIQNAIFTEGVATTETSTQRTYFGCGQSGAFYTPIGFSEVIIFRSKLTVQQRQQVEGYLANKWGLTSNLPSGHPFKTARP